MNAKFLAIIPVLVSVFSAAPEAAEHVVRIVSDYENLRMAFEPETLRIEPGDRVTWVNEADEEHDVVSYPDGYPDGAIAMQSPIMNKAGQTWSYRFTITGSYAYHCMPHLPMKMRGSVIVGRESTSDEFHRPSKNDIMAYRELALNWFDEDDILSLEGFGKAPD